MSHKHSIGVPVILADTEERGTVSALLAAVNGEPRYTISVAGTPATPSRAQGPSRSRDVNESVLNLGTTAAEKLSADGLLRVGMRYHISAEQRTAVRAQKIVVRDNAKSTDHEIAEAMRYIEAIDLVEAE